MIYENTPAFSFEQDAQDPLNVFRSQFHFPQRNGKDAIYFCGNSLGLQPKVTESYIQRELDSWKENAVEGHFTGNTPWVKYHELYKKS